MAKVLLTNGLLRKTLAAARSLGKRGVEVYAAETTRTAPAFYSKYVMGGFLCPDPAREPDAYAEWLERTIRREGIGMLVPMDDAPMDIAVGLRGRLEPFCAVAAPPEASYRIAADKGLAVPLAERAGVPCPRTAVPQSLEEAERIAREIPYPAVVKPRRSSGSRGIRVARTADELIAAYREVHAAHPLPLIQEYIPPGDRYDVCLLYGTDGALLASFVQREVRHFPLPIGPSTMQESVARPDLAELALAVMRPLEWTGVVEIEFMVDPSDGRPKFMEINPRFWNSLHAAIAAGVDFPWLLYRSLAGEPVEAVHEYETGVRCRNLLPGELLHFLANRDRLRMDPPLWAGAGSGVVDDVLARDDPGPAWATLLACARYAVDPGMWRTVFRR